MGANFVDLVFEKTKLKTKKEVSEHFRIVQDQDTYENGHSYSGTIGMASGLKFEEKVFTDLDAAYDYLDGRCQKWEHAICVETQSHWVIGALVSS